MKLSKFIFLIPIFTFVCCKNNSIEASKDVSVADSQSGENLEVKDVQGKVEIKDIEIDVLSLSIGGPMPEKIEGYNIIKSVRFIEEGEEEPILKILENGIDVVHLSHLYDDLSSTYINKIGGILIFSKKFRTKENIGVDSTIDDFISTYSKYSIWFSYISNEFVIESENSNIQFFLDGKNYIGKKALYDRDLVKLERSDFAKTAKIVAIRMF